MALRAGDELARAVADAEHPAGRCRRKQHVPDAGRRDRHGEDVGRLSLAWDRERHRDACLAGQGARVDVANDGPPGYEGRLLGGRDRDRGRERRPKRPAAVEELARPELAQHNDGIGAVDEASGFDVELREIAGGERRGTGETP